jgi:hypothetical protein
MAGRKIEHLAPESPFLTGKEIQKGGANDATPIMNGVVIRGAGF